MTHVDWKWLTELAASKLSWVSLAPNCQDLSPMDYHVWAPCWKSSIQLKPIRMMSWSRFADDPGKATKSTNKADRKLPRYLVDLILTGQFHFHIIIIDACVLHCFRHNGTYIGNRYSVGSAGMPIFKDVFDCKGNEKSLYQCKVHSSKETCTHKNDVSIACGTSTVHQGMTSTVLVTLYLPVSFLHSVYRLMKTLFV